MWKTSLLRNFCRKMKMTSPYYILALDLDISDPYEEYLCHKYMNTKDPLGAFYDKLKEPLKDSKRVIDAFSFFHTRQGNRFWRNYYDEGTTSGREVIERAMLQIKLKGLDINKIDASNFL